MFILCSVRFTSVTLGHKVLAALAPQYGSRGAGLAFIWGIHPSMLVVWLSYLIHAPAEYLHSITLSLMTHFQPSPTWMQERFPPTGRTCTGIQPRRQLTKISSWLKIRWTAPNGCQASVLTWALAREDLFAILGTFKPRCMDPPCLVS
jgi:hypothetical protein